MDISELKKAALAATPGPWQFTIYGPHQNYTQAGAFITGAVDEAGGYPVVADIPPRTKRGTHEANAAFIAAANPAAVLALIESHNQLAVALEMLLENIEEHRGIAYSQFDAEAHACATLAKVGAA